MNIKLTTQGVEKEVCTVKRHYEFCLELHLYFIDIFRAYLTLLSTAFYFIYLFRV
jgi:hypothetical protein